MSDQTRATGDSLESRAAELTRVLLEVAADEDGLVRSVAHLDELRPLRDSDVPDPASALGQGPSTAGFHAYEDAGMTTGAFLSSQSLRYQVTGDPEARRLAERLFNGICYIYDLGRQKVEGYFPKPYNRQMSEQISRDQYIYVMTGLNNYHAIADEPVRQQIRRMVSRMARYWAGIKYTKSYFGLPASSNLSDFMGSLFLGTIRIGATLGQDQELLAEYERLIREERLAERMGETLRGIFLAGGKYDGATYYRQQENPIAMKTMAIDYLWDTDVKRRDIWAAALRRFWDDEMLISLDRETGLNHFLVGFDARANKPFLTEPGVIKELENPLNLPFLTWGGRRLHSGSTLTAYAAAVAARRLGLAEAGDVVRLILSKLTLERFRGYTVPDERHIPPGETWRTHLLDTSTMAYWLWTYWMARRSGLL